MIVLTMSSRTDTCLVVSSRTDLDDDVVDVTSLSALDVVVLVDADLSHVQLLGR